MSILLMKYYIKYLIVLFLLYILLYSMLAINNKIYEGISDLLEEGFEIKKGVLMEEEIKELVEYSSIEKYKRLKDRLLSNERLKRVIKELLGEEYILHDYIWIIKKSKVHTCHRDNNGDFFNLGQKHPSYTILFYNLKKEMEILSKYVQLKHKIF